MDGWIWVSLRFATFALLVERNIVVAAAPIVDYAIGWDARRAVAYFRGRRGDVRCFPEHDVAGHRRNRSGPA